MLSKIRSFLALLADIFYIVMIPEKNYRNAGRARFEEEQKNG